MLRSSVFLGGYDLWGWGQSLPFSTGVDFGAKQVSHQPAECPVTVQGRGTVSRQWVWWCAWGYSLIPRTQQHVVNSDFPHAIPLLGRAFFMQCQLGRVLGVWTVPAWTHWTLGTIPFQKLCSEIHYSVSLDCGNKYPVKQRKALSALSTFLKSKERRWSLKTKWNHEASWVA